MTRKVVHDHVTVTLHYNDAKDAKLQRKGPMTVEEMKKLLGWQSEADSNEEFKKDYLFKDLQGNKIRLENNLTNRPFRMNLAKKYMNEMLRNKWKFNGETLIFDKRAACQSVQHRGVGFIFAEQERERNKDYWKAYGHRGPMALDCMVVEGIEDDLETVQTLDKGLGRNFADDIYRDQYFAEDEDGQRQRKARILDKAVRLCWIRSGGKMISDAPHFPVSEAFDFLELHPRIQEAVEVICTLEGSGVDGRNISGAGIPVPVAAALLYLQAAAKTDGEKFETDADALNLDLWDKAVEFWQLFASGASLDDSHPILVLRKMVGKMDSGAASARDLKVSLCIKSWNSWVDHPKKKMVAKDLAIKMEKNEKGKKVPAEFPRIGGLDRHIEVEIEEEEEEVEETKVAKKNGKKSEKKTSKKGSKKADAKGKKVSTPNGVFEEGQWVWVGEGKEAYKGRLTKINNGLATVQAEDGESYPVELKELSNDKPE